MLPTSSIGFLVPMGDTIPTFLAFIVELQGDNWKLHGLPVPDAFCCVETGSPSFLAKAALRLATYHRDRAILAVITTNRANEKEEHEKHLFPEFFNL